MTDDGKSNIGDVKAEAVKLAKEVESLATGLEQLTKKFEEVSEQLAGSGLESSGSLDVGRAARRLSRASEEMKSIGAWDLIWRTADELRNYAARQ